MRHIKTHSIEIRPDYYLVGYNRRTLEYVVKHEKGDCWAYTKRDMIEQHGFNPDDHDLTKLGTEVKE